MKPPELKLYRPSDLHSFLKELGIHAKKSLSQNFLIDGNIIEKIVKTAAVEASDLIIEIGPGPGALTQKLLETGARVIAIEKDRQFAAALTQLQTPDERLQIFEQDFLEFPLEAHVPSGKKIKVVANLPYHLTTPILSKLVPHHALISSLTLMVQHEVGLRMCASENSSDYSSLSVFLKFYAQNKYCFSIEPTCFYPRPKVRSAVVQLQLHPPQEPICTESFFLFVRTAFQQRRKMLKASLKSHYPSFDFQQALQELGLNPQARPENLSLNHFLALFRKLETLS